MLKKIILVVIVLVVLFILVVVGGVFWVGSQINSDSTREMIRQKASEAVGAEVQLTKHQVSLLGSLRLEGVAVSNAAPHQASPLLSVKSFDAKVSLLSLFQGKPTVNLVEVQGVDVQAYQSADGSLSLPFKPAPPAETPEAKAAEAEKEAQLKQLHAVVQTLKLSEVNVQVFDPEKSLLAGIKGLNVNGSAELAGGQPSVLANVDMASLEVTPGLKVTQIKSPLSYQGGQAVLSKISGLLAGGTVGGQAKAQLLDPARAFDATLTVKDSAMGDLLKDIGSDPESLSGLLQLDFAGQGTLNAPKDLTGKGTFVITDPVVGKLKNSPVPAGLVGLPALQNGKFDSIKGVYHIEGQKVVVDDLQISSKGLSLVVTGDVGFDKKLNLNGRVKIESSPVGKVADVVADVAGGFLGGLLGGKKKEVAKTEDAAPPSQPSPAPSESMKQGVPFTITGVADKPVLRVEGADPLNIISLVAKTLGFEVAPSTGQEAPTETPAPTSEAVPAP